MGGAYAYFRGRGGLITSGKGGLINPFFCGGLMRIYVKMPSNRMFMSCMGKQCYENSPVVSAPPPPPTFTCSCACVVCLYVGVRVWCMYPDKIMSKVPCARECTCEHGCVGVWVVGEMYTTF